MCNKHYLQVRRGKLVIESFTKSETTWKFIRECLDSNTDECITYPGPCSPKNYPSLKYKGNDHYKIGWIILEESISERPSRQHVMRHLCGQRLCCNPKHLAWGTELENASDRKRHGTEADRRGAKNGNYRHGGYVKCRN